MATHYEELQTKFSTLLKEVSPNDAIWEFICDSLENWQKQGTSYLSRMKNTLIYHDSLLKTLKALHEERNIQKLLNTILDKAIELTRAERGFLLVEGHEIARNFTKEDIVGIYQISKSIASQVQESGQSILAENAKFDPRFSQHQSIQEFSLFSILCVPVILDKKVIGVIYLDNRLVRGCFQEDDLEILKAFAEQAAVAIYNATLNQALMNRTQELNLQVTEQSQRLEIAERHIKQLSQRFFYHNLYSRNAKMQQIFSIIEKVKNSNIAVLIQGESGTGKELIARAIHFSSIRQDKPFIPENCGAIPNTLAEDVFFGHIKGAFSGAIKDEPGIFEQADTGTIFLDEISELDYELQKKLLRILQDKSVRRIGSTKIIPLNIRIISATNKDLAQLVADEMFREDLYFRLKVVTIELPPLRERKEDIPSLFSIFLKDSNEQEKKNIRQIEQGLLSILMNYDWPGNIRELKNTVNRLVALDNSVLRIANLPKEITQRIIPTSSSLNKTNSTIRDLNQLIMDVEKNEIIKALSRTNGNRSAAATLLGISRFSLLRKIEKCGITE